jgi:hypothetical protein
MVHPHRNNNDGFRSMATDTETSIPNDHRRCPRRVVLGWPHIVVLVAASIALGVGFTMQLHCNDQHPSMSSLSNKQSTTTTNVKNNNTTNPKALYVENNTPTPLPNNNDGKGGPKVAWLMSFPNSGTSFTSKMVRHLSHQSTASNYGEELLDKNGRSIPMFNSSLKNGPFWIDPQAEEFNYTRPTTFALTKTHCGGRCEKCGPSKYVENPHSFLTACCSGKIAHTTPKGDVVKEPVTYDRELVQRAVHLIRSPFDNVVSRFHLERHTFVHHNETKKLQMYPASRQGFRKFCLRLNQVYEREEESSRLIDSNVFQLMKNVPCRDDFFRFVQWHNLAFVTTSSLKIPTLVLHYESYDTNYNSTAMELFEFLQLEPRGELIDFIKGKEYVEYFSLEERERVKKAMKMLALSSTWEQISHYFD